MPLVLDTLEECPTPAIRPNRDYLTWAAASTSSPAPSASTAIPPAAPTSCAISTAFHTRFADHSFDRLLAIHVIEHVADVIATMEEFHRLVRPGGTVRIETPHYTDFSSFCDPTHRSHLNSYSFRYFGEDHGGFGYYTKAKFARFPSA
jgi:SAM-dependent methyltransferase